MAKRRLMQWMRDSLKGHANTVVVPPKERKALDAAYRKAEPLVLAMVAKRFPPAEMKVLAKYGCTAALTKVRVQLPNGAVLQFEFDGERAPKTPDTYSYRNTMFVADATTGAAIERWEAAVKAYEEERQKRLAAYKALIDGASYIEDVIDVWPEAAGVLPAGSPPIPLGPEQIALVKADLRERKAA